MKNYVKGSKKDRNIIESMNIRECTKSPREYINQKNGGPKRQEQGSKCNRVLIRFTSHLSQ